MQPKRKRICNWPGCGAVTTGKYCERHAAAERARKKDRSRRHDARRGTSAQRGYDADWRQVRAAQLARYPWCAMCGAPADVVDHVKPLRAGGTHAPSNLRSLCKACHSRKTNSEDGGFGNPMMSW